LSRDGRDAAKVTGDTTVPVAVVYALAERQVQLELAVAAGTTAREVACQSGLEHYFPELDLQACPLGVYGEAVGDDYVVEAGDRVELYRELVLDPMELRRERAKKY